MKTIATDSDLPPLGADVMLALIAVGALAIGALVYVLDRPAVTVYLLPQALSFADGHRVWFGGFGDRLPAFAHVYAFILLTVAVSPWPRRVLPVCAFWWLVASLGELGQHVALAPHIVAVVPRWFQQLPVLDNTANYVLYGTFDRWDLVAVGLGTVSAYVTVKRLRQRGWRRVVAI